MNPFVIGATVADHLAHPVYEGKIGLPARRAPGATVGKASNATHD
jgi:hypothetical protein